MHNWKSKLRPKRKPQGKSGPVKTIVGNTPSIPFKKAKLEKIMTELSPTAELLLLILVANGGSMLKHDAERELARVQALSPEEFKAWRSEATMLAKAHAARVLKGKDFL